MASKYYVKNTDLLEEIKIYKATCKYDPETGKYIKNSARMHDKLARMVMLIANGLGSKGNFSGYTWREDMVGEGILTVLKYLHNFNPEKSNNPFAYITQICSHAFKNYLKNQKKASIIKNVLWDHYDIHGEEADPTGMGAMTINYQSMGPVDVRVKKAKVKKSKVEEYNDIEEELQIADVDEFDIKGDLIELDFANLD